MSQAVISVLKSLSFNDKVKEISD